jgi:hypothetical protein
MLGRFYRCFHHTSGSSTNNALTVTARLALPRHAGEWSHFATPDEQCNDILSFRWAHPGVAASDLTLTNTRAQPTSTVAFVSRPSPPLHDQCSTVEFERLINDVITSLPPAPPSHWRCSSAQTPRRHQSPVPLPLRSHQSSITRM